MKIKTKLQIATVVSLIVALVIGSILFFSARQVNEAIKKEKAADEIIRGLFELNILTNEYLIHHEERAKIQWQLKHDSIKRFLEEVEVESPEKIVLLKRMHERHKDIKNIFSQMVANYEDYGDEKEGVSQELNEVLVGNLDAKSRSMVSDAYQLAEISSARLIASQQKAYLLVLLFSLIMAVVVATVSFSIHSGVVKPIRKLHEGTEIIGAGNLNYKVGTMAKDEVGQLSRAFDRMTIQLEESFAGLEKEIAERKEAEEALQESEKRYRQVVENAVEIIYTTDVKGNFTYANDAALKTVGYSFEELQRFNYLDLVVPEHRERLSKIYNSQFREKQATTYVEFPFLNKSGKVMWFGQNASLVIEGGKITGFHIIARDITERKRAEEELRKNREHLEELVEERTAELRMINEQLQQEIIERKRAEESRVQLAAIVESSNDAIIGKTLDGTILSWNSGAENLYGYSPEEVKGRPISTLAPPDRPDEVPMILARIKRGESSKHYETIRVRKDGRKIYVSLTTSPIKDMAGNIIGASTIARDVTERKRAEEEIKKLNQELKYQIMKLEAANKELEAFSYSVSHDLRAPLRAIDGFSRILLEDYIENLDEEGKRVLSVIRNNTQKMGQLIDDLLLFSRLGRREITPSDIRMTELAKGVFEEIKPPANGRNLQFNMKTLPLAQGDRSMMKQVFANLLSNAIKFTRPKEIATIEIGGTNDGVENIYYVKDNGVGFDMQYVNKLFGVFQRLHSSEEFEGTGVGLAIVQRIIHRHGGRVWAEGKVGEGANFYFTLPRGTRDEGR